MPKKKVTDPTPANDTLLVQTPELSDEPLPGVMLAEETTVLSVPTVKTETSLLEQELGEPAMTVSDLQQDGTPRPNTEGPQFSELTGKEEGAKDPESLGQGDELSVGNEARSAHTTQLTDEPKPTETVKKNRRRATRKDASPAPADEAEDLPGNTDPVREHGSTGQPTVKKRFYDLDFRELDRDLSPQQREEWESIYASYRSKSTLTGSIAGPEEIRYTVRDKETGDIVVRKIPSVAIIQYRVKVLIPETEMWMQGEERPDFVMRNMSRGAVIDYVILEVDRENECAVASRRLALAAKRHYFATAPGGHHEGELMKCRVLAVGPKKCLVEAGGYDLTLTQRDLSYTAIADLRDRYTPGEELDCRLKEYDRRENRLVISVKEVNPNPFDGADRRHPVGSRRQAVISGKYGGGVFCTLPDDTVCLCLYSPQHQDSSFRIGDNVMVAIRQYDYRKKLIYGRILSRW